MPLKLSQSIVAHNDRVWTLAWNPNGNLLASSGADKLIHIWSLKDNEWTCSYTLTKTHSKSIRRLCWSPCGQFLASASFDATVNIWKRDTSDGSWSNVISLEGHENEVKSVAWSHDGKYLASCGRDRTVWIWERSTGDEEDDGDEQDNAQNWDCSDVKNDHNKDVKDVVWHPHHNILVSCSYDDTVKIFHLQDDDWKCYETLQGHSSTVWSADFSASGEFLVTCSDDRTVKVWKNHSHHKLPDVESNSWKCISTIQGYHERSIYDISWSKLCDNIVSASGDNSLAIYRQSKEPSDEGNFVCVERLSSAHQCDVNTVVWNPTKLGLLASGSDDGSIKFWQHSEQLEGRETLKPVVQSIVENLSQKFAKATIDKLPTEKYLEITDQSDLVTIVHNLQIAQDNLKRDTELSQVGEALDLKIPRNLDPLFLNDIKIDSDTGNLNSFDIHLIDSKGEIIYRFHLTVDKSILALSLPKRTSKIFCSDNEVFLIEKTGDLFKVLPRGNCQLLLGHLFSLSDVRIMSKTNNNEQAYIISADRDEKIRISRYPDTFIIERFCFGHQHFIRRIIIVDDHRFLSIDQESNAYLWNINNLEKLPNEHILKPERTVSLADSAIKRARVS